MKQKNKKEDYWNVIRLLGAILLGNLLTGKSIIRADEDTIRAGEGTSRASQDF